VTWCVCTLPGTRARDGVLATRPCELVEERRNEWSCIATLWLMTIDCAVSCATELFSCFFVPSISNRH
jgi:hypothetical protein